MTKTELNLNYLSIAKYANNFRFGDGFSMRKYTVQLKRMNVTFNLLVIQLLTFHWSVQ